MGRMLFQDMLAKSKNCLNGLKKDLSHNDLGLYKNDPHHIITYCFVLGDLCVLFPIFFQTWHRGFPVKLLYLVLFTFESC